MCEAACSKLLIRLQDETGSSPVIDSRGYRLIHQALTEAASLGTECEIEQMVRARNVPAVRQRVQVQFEYDASDRISALRVTFERDGEVVRTWLIRNQSEILELVLKLEGSEIDKLTDLFTAIYINMHTAKQYIKLEKILESRQIIDRIIPDMQAFWLKSKEYNIRRSIVSVPMVDLPSADS